MNNRHSIKRQKRQRRHARVRSIVTGTEARPRLSIFRSASNIYAQLIDDENGRTLAAASSEQIKTKAAKRDISIEVGKVIAGKAKDKGITSIVFDRGGYRYMGRVKALADACREAGLQF